VKVSRDTQRPFRYFFDQVLPPVIRDSRLFLLALRLVFGKNARVVWTFRERFGEMTDSEVQAVYQNLAGHALKIETDINQSCIERLKKSLQFGEVLDVGCGTGMLAHTLSGVRYTGVDFVRHMTWESLESDQIKFIEATVEKLPFENGHFDYAICAHVLEHVRNPQKVLQEIARCCKSSMIVILPRERSYRAGFNLHVHHYSYKWEVEKLLACLLPATYEVNEVDGDFYAEIQLIKNR
jgi:ubiquinone/menaquinone biosynthesis C-methylase UbiE